MRRVRVWSRWTPYPTPTAQVLREHAQLADSALALATRDVESAGEAARTEHLERERSWSRQRELLEMQRDALEQAHAAADAAPLPPARGHGTRVAAARATL